MEGRRGREREVVSELVHFSTHVYTSSVFNDEFLSLTILLGYVIEADFCSHSQ